MSFDCAIDFLAGPTEALVLSESGDPRFIAADLVSQAEHDSEALCVFITTNGKLAEAVEFNINKFAGENATAKQSLWWSLALVALASFTLFFGLGRVALLGPDEPRYAEIAREMFTSVDWISPRLCGCLWF